MKFTKKLPLMLVALMLMAAGTLTISGCGEQPLAPIVGDTGGDIGDGKYGDNPAESAGLIGNVLNVVNVVVKTVTKVIGVSGGEICESLGDGRKCGLTVPAGAVNNATPISMKMEVVDNKSSTKAVLEFGPAGLKFNKATTLFLDVRDANGTVKTLTWYNPAKRVWEVQGRATVRNGRVQFSVYHFSKYGIS